MQFSTEMCTNLTIVENDMNGVFGVLHKMHKIGVDFKTLIFRNLI